MNKTNYKGKGLHTYPCPTFTRLRYNHVGSASVQICCKRLTMSASFALSSFFLLRRRGVAPVVFVKLATAALCCCGAVGGWGARRSATGPFTATVACDFIARSADAGGPGERWSFVVLARTSVSLRGCMDTDRWEFNRSRLGCAGCGGDGAGRYDAGGWDVGTTCWPPEEWAFLGVNTTGRFEMSEKGGEESRRVVGAVLWTGFKFGSAYKSARLTVFAREGRGGVGGTENVAISLVGGRVKGLNSCCGVEGAVEKGSDSASWIVVGGVNTGGPRERVWRKLRDLWWETEAEESRSRLLEGFEALCELGGGGACLEGTKGSLYLAASAARWLTLVRSCWYSWMDCLDGLWYSTVIFEARRLDRAGREET